MNETLMGISVLATALFDWSLALATGALLAGYWLRGRPALAARVPRVRSAASLMAIALVAQFYLMVAMMTGQSGFAEVLRAAPLVATTHAGKIALATLGVSALLLLADLLQSLRRPAVFTVLVALLLALHSATGHAAVDGDFTVAELLQLLHLAGMALWTGGVIVSGLFVVPRLIAKSERGMRECIDAAYLQSLSRVSTYAVAVVLLSGVWKGWTGLDHQLGGLLHPGWGRILLTKLLLVTVALVLGALHRRWIHRREQAWTRQQTRTLRTTLRVEAVCLTLVLVLSAWLGSVDPSGS
jgi:putative copper resistance protein D